MARDSIKLIYPRGQIERFGQTTATRRLRLFLLKSLSVNGISDSNGLAQSLHKGFRQFFLALA
jgi:hypothetical protein